MTDTPTGAALVRMPEQATAQRDVTILGWGDVLRPQDDVLAQKSVGRGLRLYDELARDGRVSAVLDKRAGAVIRREWKVEPGGPRRADKQAAKLAERLLAGEWGLGFDILCRGLLGALLKGYAVAELIWDARDGFVVPVAAKIRDPRRFVFDRDWQLRMLTPANRLDGEPMPARKFIVHRFGSEIDPYGLGLGHRLFWPVFFKRNALQFWAVFAERFGMPTVKGIAGAGADPDKLLKDLAALASRNAIVVPEGTEVDLLDGARGAGVTTYEGFARYLDEQIAEAVLGETLSTNVGSVGSKAAAETHNDVREDLCDSDCDELSATLNGQLLTWLAEVNFPDAAPPTVWRPRPESRLAVAETKKAEAEANSAAAAYCRTMRESGWAPEDPDGDFEAQAGGRWIWVGMPEPPPTAAPLPAAAQARFAAPPAPARDAADDLSDQLEAAAQGDIEAMIAAIRAELDASVAVRETPAQFAERLARLEATMPIDGLVELLRDSMVLGALTGMDEHGRDR